jgi:hypothetical protein
MKRPRPIGGGLGHYILGGPDGHTPILEEDFLEWAKWYEKRVEVCRVAWTEIANVGVISTIFLGLDHGFGSARPVLFETMSQFGEGWGEEYFARYHTWDEAIAGHMAFVAEALATVEQTADRVAVVLVPAPIPASDDEGKS